MSYFINYENYVSSMKRNAPYSTDKRGGKRARASSANLDVLVARKVKNELAKKGDRHWINLAYAAQNVDFSGSMYNLLSGIDRGTAQSNEFAGSKITPLWITVRYNIVCSGGTYNNVRVIIGQMLRQGGATPATVSALMNSTGSSTAPLTGYNQAAHGWYRILHDNLVTVCAANNIAETVKVFIPGKKLIDVTFDNGASNPDVLSGGLFMLVLSDDRASTYPTFAHESNVIYTD